MQLFDSFNILFRYLNADYLFLTSFSRTKCSLAKIVFRLTIKIEYNLIRVYSPWTISDNVTFDSSLKHLSFKSLEHCTEFQEFILNWLNESKTVIPFWHCKEETLENLKAFFIVLLSVYCFDKSYNLLSFNVYVKKSSHIIKR